MSMIDVPHPIPRLRRLRSLYAGFLLALMLIIGRLWLLQVVDGPGLAAESVTQQIRRIRRVAPRGTIEDRTGILLATSRPKYVVSITPQDAKKNPGVLNRLAALLGVTGDSLQQKITTAGSWGPARYDPVPLASGLDIKTLSRIEEDELDLPGVLVARDPVRYYADKGACSHILGVTRPITREVLQKMARAGYRGGDLVGIFGLEKSYEAKLRGTPGSVNLAVDARGKLQRNLGEISPQPGDTLRLTLDYGLQQTASQALAGVFNGPNGLKRPGAVIALDPNTGGVLALASSPTYDLNGYGKLFGQLNRDPALPLINRASGSAYPCGSVFKLITAAAGLETGAISTATHFYCPGYLKLGRRRFRCDEVHGDTGFFKAIGASCNVFFFHTSLLTGPEPIIHWAHQYGLGKRPGLDIPADARGFIPTPAWKRKRGLGPWEPGDTLNMAIGQGFVRVTPLQIADYVAAIANGGTLWKPRLVQEIIDPRTKRIEVVQPEANGKVGFSEQVRDDIVQGMERTLQPGGTAAAIAIPGIQIAGKTGTVQIRHGAPNNAAFVGFAPVDHPQIVVMVYVEAGGYGAQTAAPIARLVFRKFFQEQRQVASAGPAH